MGERDAGTYGRGRAAARETGPPPERGSGTFDAWALPSWASVEATEAVRPTGGEGVEVRYPAADPAWVARLAAGLVDAGPRGASPAERAAVLGRVGARFLDPSDPLRAEALRLLPGTSGLSAPMAEEVLDGMAADWTADRLARLIVEELGAAVEGAWTSRGGSGAGAGSAVGAASGSRAAPGPGAASGAAAASADAADVRASLPIGPRLCVQLVAGSVPGVGVTALLRSLLVGAPTLLKPGLGDVVLPVLFARALREASPALADELAIVYWPGASEQVERAALAAAEVAVVYGGDDTVAEVRTRTPATTRLVEYHHREGVGVVGSAVLSSPEAAAEVAEDVAWAVSMFDQRGCVSPGTVYVEAPDREPAVDAPSREPPPDAPPRELPPDTSSRGTVMPAAFAGILAASLARLEDRLPSGALDPTERAALHQLRGTAELLGAAGGGATIEHGGGRSWTVIYDPDAHLGGACVGRSVIVRPFRSIGELLTRIAPRASHLQTVGVAGLGERLEPLASELGRLGASRVTPFRTVPFPPPWWHHDGRGPLLDLVRWVDLEGG